MRQTLRSIAFVAAVSILVPSGFLAAQDEPQRRPQSEEPQRAEPRQRAQPRDQAQPQEQAKPREQPEPREQARPRTDNQPQQAEPRRASPPEQRAEPRRTPPPRVVPPHYYSYPRRYYFPPVSLRPGFYYHPYFGFYYGPYYGPFYPYPGPYYRSLPFSASAIRVRVKPVETAVYVNGYYAGIADDFDGVFQRLYVPAGNHDIELRLDGYEPFEQKIYIAPGDTLEITHLMRPLGPSEAAAPPPMPEALPPEWAVEAPPAVGEQPASPYGILALRVQPSDAQIFVDDEAWLGMGGRSELSIHLPAGWHRLEVRSEGYQPFSTELELSEGITTRLSVTLKP
jgi:hypothetical protein